MEYEIQALNAANTQDYASVNALAWRQSYRGIVSDPLLRDMATEAFLRESAGRLGAALGAPNDRAFILYLQGEPSGIVRVRKSAVPGYEDCGELSALYLLEHAKGKGFGRVLFQKAIEESKKMGYSSMVNTCFEANASNRFYLHMGGVPVGKRPFRLPDGQTRTVNVYYYDGI